MTAVEERIESPAAGLVRSEARAWFEANWDAARPLGEWWDRLARSGWGFPAWPTEWFGKGLDPSLAVVADEERRRVGAAGPPTTLGTKVIAPLLLDHGTDDQKRSYLLPTIAGQAVWCELFSEPDAGSDLAGIRTRATRDGDEWMVSGQKVWSSGATIARWGLLVARTDPDVPKRQGLTGFVLDMDQSGVDARPLRTMTGEAKFSEVFLTDARIPNVNVIGDVGGGWALVKATLALERKIIGPAGGAGGGMSENSKPPALDQPAGSVAAVEQAGQQRGAMMMGTGASALVVALLERFGGSADHVVRQDVARLHSLLEVSRYTGLRARAAAGTDGPPGPEAAIAKLLTGKVTRTLRELALRLEGPHGMLAGADAPLDGVVQRLALTSPSMSIMLGTDEILRNVIGERVLGLPPEPSPR